MTTATTIRDTRARWVGLTLACFVLFIFLGSGSRQERALYGAPPMAAALLCLGRFFWLYGQVIIQRQWHVFRGLRFEGRRAVVGFAYPMRGMAASLVLAAFWVMAIWLQAVVADV